MKVDTTNNNDEGYLRFLKDNIHKFVSRNYPNDNSEMKIDFIKAGKFDDKYTNKLNAIDWIDLYKNAPAFFRIFAQYLRKKI